MAIAGENSSVAAEKASEKRRRVAFAVILSAVVYQSSTDFMLVCYDMTYRLLFILRCASAGVFCAA